MKYICKYCGKELPSYRSLGGHVNCCKCNPNNINTARKKSIVKEKIKSTYNIERDDLFCRYCGKQCKTENSLKQHEIKCKDNPERYGLSDRSD